MATIVRKPDNEILYNGYKVAPKVLQHLYTLQHDQKA